MRPETRYARNGDVHIAYQVSGDGPIDVIMVPGFVSNVNWPGNAFQRTDVTPYWIICAGHSVRQTWDRAV